MITHDLVQAALGGVLRGLELLVPVLFWKLGALGVVRQARIQTSVQLFFYEQEPLQIWELLEPVGKFAASVVMTVLEPSCWEPSC